MATLAAPPARPLLPRPRVSRADAVLVAVVALAGTATWLLARPALVDDAYITLSYAQNVALHGTWGLLSDVPSNAATSPAWVLLLAATTVVVRDTGAALGLLHVTMVVTAALALRSAARHTGLPSWVGPVGAVLVVANPLVLSTTGLETQFLVLLSTCLLAAAAARRPALYGLAAGLLLLTRMDTAVALVVLTLLSPAVLRRLHVAVGVALAVVLPWSWWSWTHLGSVLPDTLAIKSGQEAWGSYDVGNGWGWWAQFDSRLVVLAAWGPMAAGAVATLGLVVLAVRAREPRLLPWTALGLAGPAHWATLAFIGVPPYHWYFGFVIATGTLTVVALLGAITATGWSWTRPVVALACTALLLPAGYVDLAHPAQGSLAPGDRAAVPWRVAPVQSNWMSSAAYEAMGADLRRLLSTPDGRVQRVAAFGELGHLAHSCDCLVDGFADPALLGPDLAAFRASSPPWLQGLLDVDHRHRDPDRAPVPLVGRLVYLPDPQVPPAGAPSWAVDLNPGHGHVVLLREP
jgi:hypothetical protein